jgi:hypothetical protein
MNTRTFARIWGILFLLAGASGFIPGLWHPAPAHYPDLMVESFYGDAMGLFPVNILHNFVHLLFGAWGLLAARSLGAAKTYARIVAIAYGVLIIAGLIPGLNTMPVRPPPFPHPKARLLRSRCGRGPCARGPCR